MTIKPTLMALSLAMAASATAAPVNPVIVNGQVTFARDGNALTVTNSPNAIINWSSFSIAQGELVRFVQQSGNSSVLNRITGQDPSVILGTLQSNGRVFLINPNGIVFGAGSQINVGGLVASSLAISNADFLSGNRRFAADGPAGQVSNQGAITTPSGGQVYLIAPDVNNTGIITTPQGETVLAAGHSVQLVDSSNPGMHVVVSAQKDQALNLGTVIAQGGNIGIYGALVNQRGTLNANSAVVGANGKVVLKSATTLLEAGSVTTATGVDCGGDIQVLGEQVGVMGNARIDASGQRGGGRVLVGGDYQGKNPAVLNARQSYVSQDARIAADALASGDGGKIVVWGNDTTRVYGTLSARGGAASGKGGLVETSGHFLDVAGARVDTRAANGTAGFWQLDPANILVTSFLSGPSASLGDVSAFANAPGADSEIDADLLSNATSNVLLQATHDITFYTGVNNTQAGVGLTAQAGNDIHVNSLIQFTGDITLAANHNGAGTASGSGRVFIEGQPTAGGRLTITDIDRPLVEPLTPPVRIELITSVQVASNQIFSVINSRPSSLIPDIAFLPGGVNGYFKDLTKVGSNTSVGKENASVKKTYCN